MSPLQPLTLFFNIYAHRLCTGGHKNNNNNIVSKIKFCFATGSQ